VAGDELAFGLVIQEDAPRLCAAQLYRPAVDRDRVPRPGAIAELGEPPRYRDPAGLDPGFDLAP
jgi:hypothetical protein